jgi:hypothetical protein
MGQTIIKLDANEDFYVLWSSVVDAPVAFGTREEIAEILIADAVLKATAETQERFARVDEHGTSSMIGRPPEYSYDDGGMIYQQQGWLKRSDLKELCIRLGNDENADVSDLLAPFEDEED